MRQGPTARKSLRESRMNTRMNKGKFVTFSQKPSDTLVHLRESESISPPPPFKEKREVFPPLTSTDVERFHYVLSVSLLVPKL